jgi:hypothetical protein
MVCFLLGIGRGRVFMPMATAAFCLLLTACSATPERLLAGTSPDDPGTSVPAISYRSVFAGYATQRPVAPAPWREQNERVAPTPK